MSALDIRDVSKTFDGVDAIRHLSLSFQEGEITALIGPNGAGKTTIFNLISGFLKPDAGQVMYRGMNIAGLSPWRIANLRIGRLFQDVRVFNRMTVIENVLAAFNKQKGESALRSVLMRWKVAEENRQLTERAISLLELVGLSDKQRELAENLSYGQQKLLALARLLAAEANVLLLDEPTAGVSAHTVVRILNLIRALAKEDKVLVIIEHNMTVVSQVADQVYFIDKGKMVASGSVEKVLGDPDVKAAYIGV